MFGASVADCVATVLLTTQYSTLPLEDVGPPPYHSRQTVALEKGGIRRRSRRRSDLIADKDRVSGHDILAASGS